MSAVLGPHFRGFINFIILVIEEFKEYIKNSLLFPCECNFFPHFITNYVYTEEMFEVRSLIDLLFFLPLSFLEVLKVF